MHPFFKPFAIYTILSVMLTIGACTCGPDGAGNKQLPKSISILICTANVQNFETGSPADVFRPLASLRQETDDLVLIGLQEVPRDIKSKLKNAFPGYSVYHYDETFWLANAWIVLNKLQLAINPIHIDLPVFGGADRRFATILDFPAIKLKIANTHLLGGRFDDPKWSQDYGIRNKQMQAILAYQPTIIMGDFNADNTPHAPLVQYWRDFLGQNSEEELRSFIYSIHQALGSRNYVSMLGREDVKHTVDKGGVKTIVDWIYATQAFTRGCEVIDRGVIRAISKGLSDHDFPWIRIRVEVPLQ